LTSINVFLLGAGRPAKGKKPSALKKIALNTSVMDWQIHSFESIASLDRIHYLGGYQVEDVIDSYPDINYTVVPDWQERNVLHTLLKAPFSGQPAITAYSDTLFRKETVAKMAVVDADVVFCIDSCWKDRFNSRQADDISLAETVDVELSPGQASQVEFTGLIYFNKEAVSHLTNIDEAKVGTSLLDLLSYLKKLGLSVKPFDVSGAWAELNSPDDIAHFILGTKSETLARLESRVQLSHIGKQVNFTCAQWRDDSKAVLKEISQIFSGANLIVRSSSKAEDGWFSSNAGGFESLLNLDGEDQAAIHEAIEVVIASYGVHGDDQDQVLVQEFLAGVLAAGVVFTCSLETGAPYYRFNFDDKTQSTESVTAGTHGDLRTVIVSRFATEHLKEVEPGLVPVLDAIVELEQLLGFDKLDAEFAVDNSGVVHIFQVRPIAVDHSEYEVPMAQIKASLVQSQKVFADMQVRSPFVLGEKTVFANMPDWNPAEIIGVRPKPLAFSLYRQLITNDIWAQQRVEYGYRDVRPSPLISSFSGQPYVDSRASFNSFIPASLPEQAASRLANAYINLLSDNPHFHDKVEFDVAFTIWTPGFLKAATARLLPYGVLSDDVTQLEAGLKDITNQALLRLQGDTESIELMNSRRAAITQSKIPAIDKVFALLDDCKRLGTLAFSHAARAGFVATTLLKSFVDTVVMTEARRLEFLKSFNTVAGEIERDKYAYHTGELSADTLIARYGHLRPGTYELLAQAYWEDTERYLFSGAQQKPEQKLVFSFSSQEIHNIGDVLSELGSTLTVEELGKYLIEAIQSREFVKFEFTRNLSAALDYCVELGAGLNLSREDLSFLTYSDLEELKLNVPSSKHLSKLIEIRKTDYTITSSIELPSLIQRDADFYCFERLTSQPNFVTANKVDAEVQILDSSQEFEVSNKIVMIPQADPGYDWLFGHGIAGLITQFGGANSHMAIRAAEIGLPAAIGVGEKMYEKISKMKQVELDCANQVIRELM
jgi:phosphohistidine swiveling domain-containing protein